MQTQDTQSVRLIPTRFPKVYKVELNLDLHRRFIGTLDFAGEGTFSARRALKHLHRKTNSLGLNLELLQRYPFRWIVIEYEGEELITTKIFLLHRGKIFTFGKAGFEKQIFLPLGEWGEERAKVFEAELTCHGELFGEAA